MVHADQPVINLSNISISLTLFTQDSARWSINMRDDLSSGVFSYNSQTDGQSFNMDYLVPVHHMPSSCFAGEWHERTPNEPRLYSSWHVGEIHHSLSPPLWPRGGRVDREL